MRRSLRAFLGTVIALSACASPGPAASDGDPAGMAGMAAVVCVAGKQEECACPGGLMGAQACNAEGTAYDACDCGATGAGAGGAAAKGGAAGAGASAASGGAGTSSFGAGGVATGGAAAGAAGGAGAGAAPGAGAGAASGSGSGASAGSGAAAGSSAAGSSAAGSSAASGAGGTGSAGASVGAGGSMGAEDPDVCPGQTIDWGGSPTVVTGSSKALGADYDPSACQSSAGRDAVYRLIAPQTGTLTLTAEPTGFAVDLYASEGTCDADAATKCASGVNAGVSATLTLSTQAGAAYYLFVDAWTAGFGGAFTLTLTY